MKLEKQGAMMPESQDKSPTQGDSPKQSVVEVLKSVVIRKRAKREREEEEARKQQEQALGLAFSDQKDKHSKSLLTDLRFHGTNTTAKPIKPLIIQPIDTPDLVPKKKPRKSAVWEQSPQLINLSLPSLPVLPPIETFNILSSVQDITNPNPWSPLYAGKPLDSDTLNFIHRIYCRECRMEEQRRKEADLGDGGGGGSSGLGSGVSSTPSPPGGGGGSNGGETPISPMMLVEEQSLQMAMEDNKESLKRKLMFRRSIPELVDQGIYPSLKTPLAFAEQKTKLERAKTGDFLRQKLQARPDRASLVNHHILEDSTVDPSIQEKQRQLKRARLQDSLNERLSFRPGPLELVEKNILSNDPDLQNALKEGKLPFPKSLTQDDEEDEHRHQFMESDDSVAGASEGVPSPQSCATTGYSSDTSGNPTSVSSQHSIARPDSVSSAASESPAPQSVFGEQGLCSEVKSFNFTTNSASVCTSPTFSFSGGSCSSSSFNISPGLSKSASNSSLSTLSKNKKKKQMSTARMQPSKTKVIKFHEYKGPPNVVKNQITPPPSTTGISSISAGPLALASLPGIGVLGGGGMESPYHMMLHQQQMMLQWQLEVQQKNLNFLVPAAKLVSPEQLSHLSPGGASSHSASSPGSICSMPATPSSAAAVQVGLAMSVTPQPTPSPPSLIMAPATPLSPLQTRTSTPAASFAGSLTPVMSPLSVPPAPPPPPPPPPLPVKQSLIPQQTPPPPPTPKVPLLLPVATSSTTSSGTSAFTIPNSTPVAITTSMTAAPVTTCITSAATTSKSFPNAKEQTSGSQSAGTSSASVTGGPSQAGSNNKITKLEDLKVADLKIECKKRSLPVSGPKPNLLNKLAPYADEIVTEYKFKQVTSAPSKSNNSSKTSNSEKPKTPPHSAGSTGSLSSVFASLTSDDATMMPISPPSSPSNGLMDLNASIASVMSTPLSPPEESMDIQLNSSSVQQNQQKAILSRSSSITPMAIDPTSRPPSATPMDIDMNSSGMTQSLSNMLPIISQGQVLQNVSSASGGQRGMVNTAGLPGASFTVSMTKVTQPQIATQMQNSVVKLGPALQRATVPAGAGKFKPVQLQISSTATQVRPTTAIVKQIPVSSSAGVAQIHIPVSQIQPPIKVPIQVSSTTQAKVHLPPGQIHIPVSGQPGRIAVPVSGTLPMSAEVSIPVSGGTIQIPVSQLPLHLQQQVTIQIHQQLQQQAVNALAAIKKGGPNPQSIIINKAPIAKIGQSSVGKINSSGKVVQNTSKITSKATTSGKANGNTKVVQSNQLKAKTAAKPKVVKGKSNGKVNKNANKTENGQGSAETQIALGQLGQPPVLDTSKTKTISGFPAVSVKEEKPNSPYQQMDIISTEHKPEIKLEPATSPPALVPQRNGTTLVSQSQELLQHMMQSSAIVQKPVGSENLVAEQQKQIEELRQQLIQSQLKLQDAQQQAQQHQEQLRKLTLAKIASMTQQNALNSLLMEQAKTQAQIQALTLTQNDQINQLAHVGGVNGENEDVKSPTSQSIVTSSNQMLPLLQTSSSQLPLDASQKYSMTTTTTNSNGPLVSVSTPEIKTNNLTSLLQTQGLHKIDLSQTKIVQVINANGQPQFVLTSQPSSKQTASMTNSSPEGLTSVISTASRAHSVPSSPAAVAAAATHNKLQRSSTNPMLMSVDGSMKSPPNYDEAIKNKQNILMSRQSDGGDKYSQMDDVLDVLIQSGELPPSAAQDPQTPKIEPSDSSRIPSALPTSSTASSTLDMPAAGLQGATITIPAASVFPFSSSTETAAAVSGTHFVVPAGDIFSNPTNALILTSSTNTPITSPSQLNSHGVVASALHSNSSNNGMNATVPSPSSSITSIESQHQSSSQTDRTNSHTMDSASPSNGGTMTTNSMEMTMDFGDNFTNALNDLPLLDMEWTSTDFLSSPPAFHIGGTEADSKKDINLFMPLLATTTAMSSSVAGSSTDPSLSESKMFLLDSILTNGASDTNGSENVTEDVSDWLDALMPSSGLTPLSGNAPSSVEGDPVLTPKPQDVLDLFNMDETDI